MSPEFYRALVENSPEIITVIGEDRLTIFLSRNGERLLGRRASDLLGQRMLPLVHPADRERIDAALTALMAGQPAPSSMQFRMQHGSGHYLVLDTTISDLRGTEGVDGVVLTSRDVTDEAVAEEALGESQVALGESQVALVESQAQLLQAQKMEALGRLAGGVAHDMNNMLAAIRAGADILLMDAPADSPARPDLEEILAATERGAGLTRQLLTFSRQRPVRPRRLQLNDAILDLEPMLRKLVGRKATLRLILDPALPEIIFDEGQMGQVIMNLVVNAADAVAPDAGAIVIRTVWQDASSPMGASRITLSVEDNGTGMPPEIASRIFEPFYSTKGEAGTGLGLSTVYGIVTQAGGSITVDSAVGVGTAFRIGLAAAGDG